MTEHIIQDLEIAKQAAWDASGGGDLLKGRSFQERLDQFPQPERAYNNGSLMLACIDEGVPGKNVVFVAGSGIFEADKIAEILSEKHIEGTTAHEGCGAAALHARRNDLDDHPDTVAHNHSHELAQRMGVVYAGMLESEDLHRPEEFHHARVFYYDGTARGINLNLLQPDMPRGFMHSRGIIGDSEIGKHDAALAVSIAMGDHGFGDLFTKRSPFYLVAVTDEEEGSVPMVQLLEELEHVRQDNPQLAIETITIKHQQAA